MLLVAVRSFFFDGEERTSTCLLSFDDILLVSVLLVHLSTRRTPVGHRSRTHTGASGDQRKPLDISEALKLAHPELTVA